MDGAYSRDRFTVTVLLILLFAITYLDRVCISVAGPRMQQALDINPAGWGWVTGIFTLSYCLFEIPTGILGDRFGPRRVLTRIVLWWSTFTVLTGAVKGYPALLLTRFLFGAGEAGAFPNAGIVVSRWFPPSQRATRCGINLLASQIGAALSPLLVVPIQMRYGWRASFFVFGSLGVLWASVWYFWYRDSPAEKSHTGNPRPTEAAKPRTGNERFPWKRALQSQSVRALLVTFCYVYVFNFFQTWFHTFLVNGRGFSEAGLIFSFLPYVVAACANLFGGLGSDLLVRWIGAKNGRRVLGVSALAAAGTLTTAAMMTRQQIPTLVLLALAYGAITLQQSVVFGVCLDIGHRNAGAVMGLMNTSAQVGGFVGAVAFGYIVERFHSFNAPFVPMVALLFLGALCWFKIDASQGLNPEPRTADGTPAASVGPA